MTFSVAIGTFGADSWRDLAERAARTARIQTVPALEVIHVHGATLEEARNAAAALAQGEWLIFLDADDELDKRYVEHMTEAAATLPPGNFLLQPSTLGVYADGREDPDPVLIPPKASILEGNWLVIGTAIRRTQFLNIGGFASLPIWEDWALFMAAIADGAVPVPVPGAVYRVGVNENGRNNSLTRPEQLTWFNEIRRRFGAK